MHVSKLVLIVSGEPSRRETLAGVALRSGVHPVLCATASEARALLARQRFEAILCDDTLQDGTFKTVTAGEKMSGRCTPVVVVSRRDDWHSYMQALAGGAIDYLAYPPYQGEVERALEKAEEFSRLVPVIA